VEANAKKVIVVFSGPSAVGKDQMAINCIDELEEAGISARCLDKKGTRQAKAGEEPERYQDVDPTHIDSSAWYYSYKSEQEMRADEDLFFLYDKYNHVYGFPKSDLNSPERNEDVIFIIFGPVDLHKKFIERLSTVTNRTVLSVLLVAPLKDLYRRQENRKHFTHAEMHIRNSEMRKDLKRIHSAALHIQEQFDLVVTNSNAGGIDNHQELIMKRIRTILGIS